jgi:3-hydroxyisobutyrate dehydrogenase-like beta-hydroxyacid dehydrogenase
MYGFIGLGVMGEPMCRNLAEKADRPVLAFDLRPEPLQALSQHGVEAAPSVADLTQRSEIILLSLPGGPQVREVCLGDGGILDNCRSGQVIVDCSTTPVGVSREIAERFAAKGVAFADAPVAKTRAAAQSGTLNIMVGAEPEIFARIEPVLRCMGSDIAHCGGIGAGEVVKLMNNMILAQIGVAVGEALTVARRAGVDGQVLLETLMNGSADSFMLRNHAMKAMLPDDFPDRAFSVTYMLKDMSYAIDLASENGITLSGAENTVRLLERTAALGNQDLYWPVVIKAIEAD